MFLNPAPKKVHRPWSEPFLKMAERLVKLITPTLAIRSDNEHISIVTVPADAVVAIVDGDINGTGFVKIRYIDQTLAIYAKDLRSWGEDDINDLDLTQR
jgi:hypothetical protein